MSKNDAPVVNELLAYLSTALTAVDTVVNGGSGNAALLRYYSVNPGSGVPAGLNQQARACWRVLLTLLQQSNGAPVQGTAIARALEQARDNGTMRFRNSNSGNARNPFRVFAYYLNPNTGGYHKQVKVSDTV